VPIAADLAATSADLLFGEPPQLVIPDAHEKNAGGDALDTQDRLLELAEADQLGTRLLEAAEICSALGGVYVRPVWDPAVAAHPMLSVVHADRAVPVFRWGRVVAVTFWSVLRVDGGRVWRHLERHEAGTIIHGLYEGTRDRLGTRRPLEAQPETAGLAVQADGTVLIPDALRGELLTRYVPNVRPNRLHRHVPVGRPDGQGTWDLMDALDETYSSWIRDIRLGKARIIVPDQFLDRRPRGQGAGFDADREIFSPLDIDPASAKDAGITESQFKIRTQDHADTAMALVERIVATAGYSAQTFGLDSAGGGEQTATGVRSKEARSLRTTGRKAAYWGPLDDILWQMLVIDAEIFRSGVVPMRPTVRFADGLPDDPTQVAQTIMLLAQAEAASIETRVRMAQPDLDEPEVEAEVARIRAEQGTTVADPTGGFPGPGAA
jgi:A118 family predicted phage portal protein